MDLEWSLVPLGFFVGIVATVKIIADARIRRLLIQSGAAPDLATALTSGTPKELSRFGALKWGLVTGGLGLAFMVNQFLPFGFDDPFTTGVLLVFGAAGLLLFYWVTRPRRGDQEASFGL